MRGSNMWATSRKFSLTICILFYYGSVSAENKLIQHLKKYHDNSKRYLSHINDQACSRTVIILGLSCICLGLIIKPNGKPKQSLDTKLEKNRENRLQKIDKARKEAKEIKEFLPRQPQVVQKEDNLSQVEQPSEPVDFKQKLALIVARNKCAIDVTKKRINHVVEDDTKIKIPVQNVAINACTEPPVPSDIRLDTHATQDRPKQVKRPPTPKARVKKTQVAKAM